jgi:hypothetical protein
MSIFSMIFGSVCGGGKPPESTVHEEEGFVDIALTITETKTSTDGTISVVARGKLNGATVGFIVDVLPEWSTSPIEGTDSHFYWGKIRYRSTGAESNEFVAALARLYGSSERPGPMASTIEASAVGLDSDPRSLNTTPVRMKAFFFEDGPEDRYAEVYTNIDLQQKRLEFHEKDPEYRLPLLKALQDQAKQ